MARPRLYEERRVAAAIRLPVSLRGQLLEAATERDVSVNLLVTRAISEYLRHLRPLEQPDDRPPRRGNRRPSRTKPT